MSAPTPHLGRVFVSSVFGGMMDLRALAGDIARRLGFEPDLTELHNVHSSSVQSRLEAAIAACDTYIGLFDRRRGTVPPSGTVDNRAITEEELRIARGLGLRCLVFISKDEKDEREPELKDFLNREVLDYEHGVWPRIYAAEKDLRRDLAAGLAALRPRVILQLRPGAAGLETVLYLEGVKPAWPGETVLGPVPVDLGLDAGARGVFEAFLEGPPKRPLLRDEALQYAGAVLAAAALPGALGEALSTILDLAARYHVLPVLEVRTEDAAVLALPWELLSLPRHPLPVRQGLLEVVRRIDSGDPSRDTASTVPAEHLSVLGFTAAPAQDQGEVIRLGAQGGRFADADLFWEKEQERLLVALDSLLRDRRGRLVLPDTGDKEVLRKLLTREDRPQVVHISCHGGMEDRKPVLSLEDAEGNRVSLDAEELLSWVRAAAPGAAPLDLLVLSACSTASSGSSYPAPGHRAAVAEAPAGTANQAPGLAEALVRGGLGRVLGMQGPVSDSGATAFAEAFYAALAAGVDLPVALRLGRAGLKAQGAPHEWAVPTLTTNRDAGPLVAPESGGAPVETPFEAVRKDFEVAGVTYLEEGYVGRRDFERMLRSAFERGERLMVIHGLGGIGKSTLAARFLERRGAGGARVLVLYAGRELAPATLFDEIGKLLGVTRPAGAAPEEAEVQFRQAIGEALHEVVPTLLYLDNFEDQQDEDGRLRNPELGVALVELLRLGGTGLRMLLTSRLPLELKAGPFEVWNRDLGELSPSGCRKLRLLDREGLGLLDEAAWQQVLFHLGGHPKALELLGGYLRGQPDRARTLLHRFEKAIETVTDRLAAEQQERGRQLLVETVLEEIPAERRPAFDRLCLLDLAFPTQELEALLAAEGLSDPLGDLDWLRGHGLLARKISPGALSGGDAVHRLLASRQQKALAEREGEEAEKAWQLRVAEHLVQRPGTLSDFGAAARHRDAAGDRAGALALYNQWALILRDQNAYAACEQVAREGLAAFPASSELERVAAAKLWLRIYDALEPLGRRGEAKFALEEALRVLNEAESPEARFSRASVRLRKGRALATDGKPQEAEAELRAAVDDFTEGGFSFDRAVTLGDIARLRAQDGDVDDALKLHQEQLRLFEQIGDVRDRAVTLGDIARLRAQAGDVDDALKLHQERLRVYEQIGDVRSRAVTLGDIARLRAQAGDVDDALKLHQEELRVYEQIGDVRSRAVTLGYIARLRAQAGDVDDALKLHQERLRVFEQIGDVRSRAVTLGDIARLRAQAGDLAGAREANSERLEIVRRLGDMGEIAAAQFHLAQLDLAEEQPEQAIGRLYEAWEIFSKIGRADGIAFIGARYGQLLIPADRPRAISILQTSRAAFQKLGMTPYVHQIDELLKGLAGDPP